MLYSIGRLHCFIQKDGMADSGSESNPASCVNLTGPESSEEARQSGSDEQAGNKTTDVSIQNKSN